MTAWLDARNILAVRLDNIGDAVMLGPALRAVKETSPDARLTLLATPGGATAAPLLPWVDDVIVWRPIWQELKPAALDPARERELIDLLAARRFDAALVFTSFSQTPHVPGYVCYLAGIPLRAGESKEFGGATLTTELRGAPDDLHQVERNLRLVEALGFTAADRRLAVAIPDEARRAVPGLLERASLTPDAPFVLLHPGASARARRYPADRFGAVARGLIANGRSVLVTGVEREAETVGAVASNAPGAGVLLGGTTLAEYAALVEAAALTVCGNTLPLHLADAVGTPLLALYSGTDLEAQWRPRSVPARLLRRPTACHPCYLFDCPIGLPCLDVDPAEVVAEAEALLAATVRVLPTTGAPHPPPRSPVIPSLSRDLSTAAPPDKDPSSDGMTEGRDGLERGRKVSQEPTAPAAAPGTPPSREARSSVAPAKRPIALTKPPRRIAVLRALYLGDLLCATPALRALGRRFPDAEITLIGLPWATELVTRLPYLVDFSTFPGYAGLPEVPVDPDASAAFLRGVRAEPFDLAIQMHGSGGVSNGFVADLGAASSLGYAVGPDDRLTHALRWDEDEHEVRRWLRLVGTLGAPTDDARLDWPTTRQEEKHADELLAAAPGSGPLVALHAGAKDAARRWPAAQFAALADALVDRLDARVVLTGAASERDVVAGVRDRMRGPALDLSGATDLGGFAALIGRLDLLVTNDTGASHLAAAAGTPSVVLFGPSRPARWAPLDRERHRVVDALTGAPPDADPAEALARLPVETVLAACLAAIGQGARPATDEPSAPAPSPEATCAV